MYLILSWLWSNIFEPESHYLHDPYIQYYCTIILWLRILLSLAKINKAWYVYSKHCYKWNRKRIAEQAWSREKYSTRQCLILGYFFCTCTVYMKKVHVVVLKLLLFSIVFNLFMTQAQQSMSVFIVFLFIKQTDIIILGYFWLFEIFLHLTEVLYSPSKILYL